jgi:hypothetical protein
MKKIFSLIIIPVFVIGLGACGGSKVTNQPGNDSPAKSDSTKVSAYVCPMGPSCGKGDAPGKCSGCGMEMVKNEKGIK